jgi:hypothetical protein
MISKECVCCSEDNYWNYLQGMWCCNEYNYWNDLQGMWCLFRGGINIGGRRIFVV